MAVLDGNSNIFSQFNCITPSRMCRCSLSGVTAVKLADKVNSPVIISGSYDCRVRVWNAVHGICLAVLQGHKDLVRSLAVSSASRVVSGDFGGFLKVWDLIEVVRASTSHMENYVKEVDKYEERKKVEEFGKVGKPTRTKIGMHAPQYEPLCFIHHRSLFTHRGHVTDLIITDTAIVSGSREKNIVKQDFGNINY